MTHPVCVPLWLYVTICAFAALGFFVLLAIAAAIVRGDRDMRNL